MKKITILIVIVLCLSTLVVGCDDSGDKQSVDQPVDQEQTTESTPEPTEEATSEPTEEPKPESTIYNPLTGEQVVTDKLTRPIAVMIGNTGQARPQSGIAKADIVYEMPVEGGISRLMALFTDLDDTTQLGSIRSARPCFLDRAMESGAVYIHWGGSERAYADIANEKIEDIDQATSPDGVFWRESHRSAPHNGYTSMESLLNHAEEKGYDMTEIKPIFDFAESEIISEEGVQKVNAWIFQGYTVQYIYNKDTNKYDRYVNNKEYKDEQTDEAISVSNIIFQKCKTKRDDGSYDGNGRVIVYSNGSGEGYLLTGGGMQKITWSKKDRYSVTEYKDEEGNPVKLNAGKTWIHIIEGSDSVSFDGSLVLK